MGSKALIPRILALLLVVVTIMLSGCGGDEKSSSDSADGAETITIGYSIPLNAPFGMDIKNGAKIAAQLVNEDGGIVVDGKRYNLAVKVLDDQYSPDDGRTNAIEFVNKDKLKYVVFLGSAPTVAAVPITEENKVLMFSGAASEEWLKPPTKYTFRTAEGSLAHAAKFAYIREYFPDAKTIGLLEVDHEGGKADEELVRKLAPAFDFEVKDVLYYAPDTTDFTAVATKMASTKPDLVALPGTEVGTPIGLQVKALRAAGYSGPVFQREDLLLKDLRAVASDADLEGLVGKVTPDDMPEHSQLYQDFKAAYMKEYGNWPPIMFGFLDCIPAFKAAVEKADSLEVDDIMAALEGLEWESYEGKYFAIKREDLGTNRAADVMLGDALGHIENGKVVMDKVLSSDEVFDAASKVYHISK